MAEASPNSYDQLRRWYLARLRVHIQEEASRIAITPASRIASDKKAIEQIVSRFHEQGSVEVRQTLLDHLPKFLVSIPVAETSQTLLVVLLIFFAVQTCLQPTGLTAIQQGCFVACLCILAIVPLFSLKYSGHSIELKNAKILQLLRRISGQSLAAESLQNNGSDTIDILEKSIDELLQQENAIADFSKAVLICLDAEMTIEAVSLSCFSEWGYQQAELLGTNFGHILFAEDRENFVEALQNKNSFQHHCRLRKFDNNLLDCQMFIEWSPSLQRYFVSSEDISDRISLERARDNYIAQLTHDMRSPLNGIGLILENIQEQTSGELPPAVHKSVDVAAGSLKRVTQLINDILDAEKLRHGKEAIKLQPVDLVELCRSAASELQAQALAAKVQLSCTPPGETPVIVRADPVLLNRVLTNFLNNAISYSPAGAEVNLSVQNSSSRAAVRVTDQGPGIHLDYHRVIFERFGALKLPSKNNRPSTGIGLSLCQDIVKAHGGIIGLESEPGKGCTFWFSLALAGNEQSGMGV